MRTLRQQHAAARREANRQHDLALAHQTSQQTSQRALRDRSVALAELRGYTARAWAARFVSEQLDPTTGALISATYQIASASSDTDYRLTYEAAADDATGCACRSARFDHACWHRGLAIIKGRALAAQYTPAGRAAAAAEWRDHLCAEANEVALAPSL